MMVWAVLNTMYSLWYDTNSDSYKTQEDKIIVATLTF